VVDIFRARGVQNVLYTWQMTAWSFRAPSTDRRHATKWYPGNAYVDVVGADAYNWYTCGAGTGKWREFSTLADPVLAFARARYKQAAFPEFGSISHPNRATWLAGVHRYVVANKASIQALFYFHRPSTVAAYADCRWPLSTAAEFKAYGDMARDSIFAP
jgi:beta-mannanase